jgi:hypothetical protein
MTVDAGETAGFTAAADGTPAPTFRWQRSTDDGATWADIPGATGTTYTTPATVADDNGTRFRCVATNPAGDAFSRAAVLRIRTTVDLVLGAGYTLVALPVDPLTPYTSETFAQAINANGGSCTSVIRYHNNAYETHPVGSSQAIFPIEVGKGYFVRSITGPSTLPVQGFPLNTASSTIGLSQGYNLIGLPRIPSSPYTSESCAVEINGQPDGSATQVLRYANNQFYTHPVGSSQEIFDLLMGKGYFVRCTTASTWNVTR